MSEQLKLSTPWATFYRQVDALFRQDPQVHVEFDEDNIAVKIYVDGDGEKADAIAQIMPQEKVFGNVTVKVSVIPANGMASSKASLFEKAFKDNPAVSYVKTLDGKFTPNISYVVFQPKVVQYWNDNLGDINGYCSTLYQDIARDVFDAADVQFCTDLYVGNDSFGKPLGEWP